MNKYYCTPNGYQMLLGRLNKLQKEDRQSIIDIINDIKQEGISDLGESSEFLQAKDELDRIEVKIKEITDKVGSAEIVDVTKIAESGKVIFGSTVKLIDLDTDEELTYKIVGEDESDIKDNKISVYSPLAKAMIGKSVDEDFEIETPNGERYFEILEIKHI